MIDICRKYLVLFIQVTLHELHKFIYDFFKIYTTEIVAGWDLIKIKSFCTTKNNILLKKHIFWIIIDSQIAKQDGNFRTEGEATCF